VISPTQSPPPVNTEHSLERDIYAPAGFESTILEGERLLTHASDLAVTGIGDVTVLNKVTKGFRVMSPSHLKITVNKDFLKAVLSSELCTTYPDPHMLL
jgi:hypothetical protein